jgi:hypothetical protein
VTAYGPDLEYMWRAIITVTWPSGRSYTMRRGPYKAKGAATAAVNQERNSASGDSTRHFVIQRAKLEWEDVSREDVPAPSIGEPSN